MDYGLNAFWGSGFGADPRKIWNLRMGFLRGPGRADTAQGSGLRGFYLEDLRIHVLRLSGAGGGGAKTIPCKALGFKSLA